LGISKRVERWLCATHNWGGTSEAIVRASFFYLVHQELARAAEAAYLRHSHTAIAEQIVNELACGEGGRVHGGRVQ